MIGAKWQVWLFGSSAPSLTGRRVRRAPQGFTLMEILVVLAIFSMLSVTVTDIFLLSSRAERRIASGEQLAQEGRGILEFFARTVRNGTLAYDVMPVPLPNVGDTLAIRGGDAVVRTFALGAAADVCAGAAVPCLLVTENGVTAPLTSSDARIAKVRLYATPSRDPYAFDTASGTYLANEPPRVTIFFVLEDVTTPSRTLSFQTTVMTRQYVR